MVDNFAYPIRVSGQCLYGFLFEVENPHFACAATPSGNRQLLTVRVKRNPVRFSSPSGSPNAAIQSHWKHRIPRSRAGESQPQSVTVRMETDAVSSSRDIDRAQ